jgi:hypothetical protein
MFLHPLHLQLGAVIANGKPSTNQKPGPPRERKYRSNYTRVARRVKTKLGVQNSGQTPLKQASSDEL